MNVYRFIEIELDRPPASEGNIAGTLYRFLPVDQKPIGLHGIPCLHNLREDAAGVDPKNPLGKRAKFTASLVDFDDDGARYFSKLLAKHRVSYLHRPARVIEYRDGVEYQRNNYIITAISGPSKGLVSIEAKDPLTTAIGNKLPVPVATQLFSDIDAAPMREIPISLQGEEALELNGLIRINEELIRYEHIRTDSDVFYVCSCERGAYGTEPAEHSAGDSIQPCIEYVEEHPLDIARDLLDRAGITQYSDASFDFYKDFWLAGSAAGNVLSEPTEITKILGALLADIAAFLIWDGTNIQASAITPQPNNAEPILLTDEKDIISGSMDVTDNISAMVTRSALAYGRRNLTETGKEITNFRFLEVFADAEAEEEAGTSAGEVLYSDWLKSGGDAFTAVSRRVFRYRYGERKLAFSLDLSRSDIIAGDVRRISSDDFVDELGQRRLVDVLLTEVKQNGPTIDVKAVILYESAEISFAFYAPDDAPESHDLADEDQRRIMAFYGDDEGQPEYRYL